MSPELQSIIERSKDDREIIVGSEVRQLGMEITRLEAEVARLIAESLIEQSATRDAQANALQYKQFYDGAMIRANENAQLYQNLLHKVQDLTK